MFLSISDEKNYVSVGKYQVDDSVPSQIAGWVQSFK